MFSFSSIPSVCQAREAFDTANHELAKERFEYAQLQKTKVNLEADRRSLLYSYQAALGKLSELETRPYVHPSDLKYAEHQVSTLYNMQFKRAGDIQGVDRGCKKQSGVCEAAHQKMKQALDVYSQATQEANSRYCRLC